MAKKNGIFSELVQKRDLDENRFTSLDASRWSFGFQLFRAHMVKMVALNLILILGGLYLAVILVNRYAQLTEYFGLYPFSANLGFGYMPYTELAGLEREIVYAANLNLAKQLPIAGLLLGIALAGVLHVIKKILWIQDFSVIKDFADGVIKNWLVVVLTFVFSLIMGLCIMCVSYVDFIIASGTYTWVHNFTRVMCYIAICAFSLIYLQAIVMTTTYKVKFFGLIKNSFLISVILLPLNLFFALFAVIPFILFFLGELFVGIGLACVLLFGLTFAVFSWSNYCHWIYERFLGNAVKGESDEKSAPLTEEQREKKRLEKQELAKKIRRLPVKPLTQDDPLLSDIPAVFTLSDIVEVERSKQAMKADSDEFERQAVANETEGQNDSSALSTDKK